MMIIDVPLTRTSSSDRSLVDFQNQWQGDPSSENSSNLSLIQ